MAKNANPPYAVLADTGHKGGKPPHPQTADIIKLRPGRSLDVTPDDGDLAGERVRVLARVRTATATTGRSYNVKSYEGHLFVVCHKPSPDQQGG